MHPYSNLGVDGVNDPKRSDVLSLRCMKVRLGYNDLEYNDILSMTNRPNGIDYTLYLWRYTTTIAVWVTRPFAYSDWTLWKIRPRWTLPVHCM